MSCLHPVTIFVDGKQMQVPCGRCAMCAARTAQDWFSRLNLAFSNGLNVFITLTYNNDNLPLIFNNSVPYDKNNVKRCSDVPFYLLFNYNCTFLYTDVQKYFKRLRKQGLQFSYYGCAEYGPDTMRPHYHVVLNFSGLSESDFQSVQEAVIKTWNYGFSSCEFSNIQRLKYVVFYTKKIQGSEVAEHLEKYPSLMRPFNFMSKGLGKEFAMLNFDFIKSHNFLRDKNGKCYRTPRYFRKKVFELLDMDDMLKMRQVYDCSELLKLQDYDNFQEWLKARNENTFSESEKMFEHPDIIEFYDDMQKSMEFTNERISKTLSKKQNSKL